MKTILALLIIFYPFLFGQQGSFKIRPKYKHLQLIEKWKFVSMETITHGEKEEKEIVYQADNNVETLSFHRSGSISYISIDGGKEKKGRGKHQI